MFNHIVKKMTACYGKKKSAMGSSMSRGTSLFSSAALSIVMFLFSHVSSHAVVTILCFLREQFVPVHFLLQPNCRSCSTDFGGSNSHRYGNINRLV